MTSRRQIVLLLGGAALGVPRLALAQAQKVYRIGYLANQADPRGSSTSFKAFLEGLREQGWVEGKNIEIAILTSGGRDEAFPDLAAQFVREKVDVIVTTGVASTRAAKDATKDIPIVFGSSANPVEFKLVSSLSRPGGNVTGMAFFSLELGPKRLQLLKQIVPRARRIARLYSASNPYMAPKYAREPDAAARALNMRLQHIAVKTTADFESAVRSAADARADAMTVEADALFVARASRERLAELAIQHRLPMMGPDRRYADSGALLAYGENFEAMYRRAAYFVSRVLRGAKPADIPVEQPSVLELVVNLKTAGALGVSVPTDLQLTANRVIS